ncbi:MAG TPA: cytochrome c oxidase assembly protein, partial [Phenylobacterium sp.]
MVGPFGQVTPYCGEPPSPATLLLRWNLDPLLMGVMLAALGLYLARAREHRRSEVQAFVAGWALTSVALMSPLCALSVSLFSARIGQHMLLTLAAAPLVAMGRPFGRLGEGRALPAAIAFAILLWVWHAPGPYAATFLSPAVYWEMHASLFGSAVWLWSGLLGPQPRAGAIGAAAFSMIQMGLLGALITLAPRPLYAPHLLTTTAWGLSQLEDQQLGGALMWAP